MSDILRPVGGAVAVAGLVLALLAHPPAAAAHAPSVVEPGNESPATAVVLDDPTLSRAIGATLAAADETDWFRMDLRAGDPLVVEVTAPDAAGGIPTELVVLGPGLPAPAGEADTGLAATVGAEGLIRHRPEGGDREVHGGLGFIAWGGIRTVAPADGTYWIAVRASEPGATGKYVLAPGVREEFGLDAVGGMADLVGLFNAPWPPQPGADAGPTSSPAVLLVGVVLVAVGGAIVTARLRARQGPR
jgi:hypothetical protein